MQIQTNTLAMRATNIVAANNATLGRSLERLSSGLRINRGADDAAGLVISQKLRAEISGLKVATRNTQDAIGVFQTAEAAYASLATKLHRMHELQLQYLNTGSTDSDAREAIAEEWSDIRLAAGNDLAATTWAGKSILQSGFTESFQLGTRVEDLTTFNLLSDISAQHVAYGAALLAPLAGELTIDSTVDYSTFGGTGTVDMLTGIQNGITIANVARAWFGANQNRAEATLNSIKNAIENLTNSESRIRDTDMASEMVNFTRHQILLQAGTAMLAQANSLPQTTLRLLQ